MGRWAAKKVKKTCKQCKKLADPDSYAKGSKVKIVEAFDCENCEVTKNLPIPSNENIIDLYNALPHNYNSFGLRTISTTEIKFILELFDIAKELWDDYYERLLYLHSQYVEQCAANQKTKRDAENRKQKRLQQLRNKRIY